jgi:hypothetical protein
MSRKFVSLSAVSLVLAAATISPVHAYQNGALPQSALAPIYHPSATVYLQKDAAAAWNAFRQYCLARGVDVYPNGPNSAYRTYAQQVLMKRLYGSNAATPGTSNHGLGLAVDVASHQMRTAVDNWGAQFGWSKRWSDAQWEWWHIKYQPGHYHGGDPGINGRGAAANPSDGLPLPATSHNGANGTTGPSNASTAPSGDSTTGTPVPPRRPSSTSGIVSFLGDVGNRPVVRRGSSGQDVRDLQKALTAHGFTVGQDGSFGSGTEKAVRLFQKKSGLTVDGVVGPDTWDALASAP